MIVSTVEYVTVFLEKINNALGLSEKYKYQYKIENKGKFPISNNEGTLVIVPEFFHHDDISEEQRRMMIIFLYSVMYLSKNRKVYPISPEILAKGICDLLGEKYIPVYKIEETLRSIRIKIYDDVEYASFFNIGDAVKDDILTRYRVKDIKKKNGKINIVAEQYGDKNNFSTKTKIFEESELFDLYSNKEDYSDCSVDLRKNIFILSAPSATGKNTVFNELKQRVPQIKRAITATTRKPRKNEKDGIDYYFYTLDEFEKRSSRNEFVEQNLYDNGYYATPFEEIYKYSLATPLFLIIDTRGMRNVMCKFPLSTSIFLMPPSLEELEKRIRSRGDNTLEEIQSRINEAKQEIKYSEAYDFIVVNDMIEKCVEKLYNIVEERIKYFRNFKSEQI